MRLLLWTHRVTCNPCLPVCTCCRVVADFDEFHGAGMGSGKHFAGGYDDYDAGDGGQYDQDEMMRGYAM